jgi:hypothetical protein
MTRCVQPPSCSQTVHSSKKQASVFQSSVLSPFLRGSSNSARGESYTTDLASPGRAEPTQLASPKGNNSGEKYPRGMIKSRESRSHLYSPYPRTIRLETLRAASTSPIPSSVSLRRQSTIQSRTNQSNIRPQAATLGSLQVTPRDSPSAFLTTPQRSEELESSISRAGLLLSSGSSRGSSPRRVAHKGENTSSMPIPGLSFPGVPKGSPLPMPQREETRSSISTPELPPCTELDVVGTASERGVDPDGSEDRLVSIRSKATRHFLISV